MAASNATSRPPLTQARLKELLHYDPDAGVFTRIKFQGGETAGAVAGTTRKNGYVLITVDYTPQYAHRLAFLWMLGHMPFEADHKNGKRSDNRWNNLREVDHAVNCQNLRSAKTHSSSKLLGVFPSRSNWISRIIVAGKKYHLGTFKTKEEAHAAYLNAKRLLHEGCTI